MSHHAEEGCHDPMPTVALARTPQGALEALSKKAGRGAWHPISCGRGTVAIDATFASAARRGLVCAINTVVKDNRYVVVAQVGENTAWAASAELALYRAAKAWNDANRPRRPSVKKKAR